MMYERFSLYLTPAALVAMRDIMEKHRHEWTLDSHVNGELMCVWGELESRVQHLPNGIEKPEADWLGD